MHHQRLDHWINVPFHDEGQAMQRQTDAMVCQPILREIIRADALITLAGADLLFALVGILLVLFRNLAD